MHCRNFLGPKATYRPHQRAEFRRRRIFRPSTRGNGRGFLSAAARVGLQTHLVYSSMLSKRALPFLAAYSSTKSMMNALADGLRLEVRPYGVRVLTYCAPETETEFHAVTTIPTEDRRTRYGSAE